VHPNSGVVFAVAIGTIAAFLSLASDALTGEEITFTSRHYLSGATDVRVHDLRPVRGGGRPSAIEVAPLRSWHRRCQSSSRSTRQTASRRPHGPAADAMAYDTLVLTTNWFGPYHSISEAKDIALAERVEEALYLCIGQRDGGLSSYVGIASDAPQRLSNSHHKFKLFDQDRDRNLDRHHRIPGCGWPSILSREHAAHDSCKNCREDARVLSSASKQ
jgi:hypothetical protein